MTLSRAVMVLLPCLVSSGAALAAGAAGADAHPSPDDELLAGEAARLTARAGEPAAVASLAMLAGLDEKVAPRALEDAVRGGMRAGAHPLVAAQAALLQARLAGQRGDAAGAAAGREALGLVARFSVIGPFGEGRASFKTRFPPEEERAPPEAGRRYPGKVREVTWRDAEGAVREGAWLLDGLLRPDAQAVAYAVTFVRSDREQPAALRVGSPGPIQVWVNGRSALARDVVRPPALDQDAAGVRLGRGWNRILIKTVVGDGAWRLYVRLTDPAGAPLRLESAAALPGGAVAVRAPAGATPRVDTLVDALERRTRDRRVDPAEAWLDLGRALAWLAPRDRAEGAAAAAFTRALALRPTLGALLGAADVAEEDDPRRRALERAAALPGLSPPWQALVAARLAELARNQRRDTRAAEGWRRAVALDPACWPATLALADEEAEAGLPLAAIVRLELLPARLRALPRVRRAASRLYEAAGRRARADAELVALAQERRLDVDLLYQLSSRARARSDMADARARMEEAAALRPDMPSLAIDLARLYEGGGSDPDRQRALSTLEGLVRRLPDDPPSQAALGKLLHRLGRDADALDRVRAALALRPQDPDLKRYVDHLAAGTRADPNIPDELARRYAADAVALVPAETGAGAGGAQPAVVLLDRRVVRVHRNGLSRTFAQRVVQVLTDRGAEENKEFAVHYTPGSEEVEIRRARIYRRGTGGGLETLEATDRSDQDLSEPWYGLYYDNRAEIVRFEGLRPGDVLEIQYLVDDTANENQLADYFGDLQYVAETIPKRRWDYTLIAPASRPIHTNAPRLPRLTHSVAVEGDDRIYRFAAEDVAKVESEPAMPGLGEIAPYLHLSTYAGWDEVGAWYWRLVEEQLTPDDELRRTARGLARPGMSDEARVRAVYDFVVTSTRYVGLEFGIHGFKPYKVGQVLSRRFGDCKDKAALMIALLREVGVPAELVLVRTRRGGRLEPRPASLAVFDHAVVYVPKLDRYLDGTAEFSGATELPTQDQGVMVLRVGPRGSRLTETPVMPSSDSRVERRWQVELEPSGDARVDERMTIRGQAAPNWRQHYQTAGERAERYGRAWNGRFPGARLEGVDMPDVGDRNAPVVVKAAVAVPRLGRLNDAGTMELPVSARDADFVRTYARLSARRYDLVLAYPWQHEEHLSYRLPAGWRLAGPVATATATRRVEGRFGRFRLEIRTEGDVVHVRSSLDVVEARIAPADYPGFRSFLGEVDAALEQPLVIAPAQAGS